MKKLRLDFVQGVGLRQDVGYLLLGLFALLLGTLMLKTAAIEREASQLYDELKQARAEVGGEKKTVLSGEDKRRLGDAMTVAKRISGELNLPWGQFFASLEHAKTDNIGLLEIATEPKSGAVHITAEARAYPAMLDYVARLSKEPALAEVYLIRHRVDEQNPEKPVQFTVEAIWKPQ